MLRKISSVSLAVSFFALATSGLMIFFIEKPSFTLQMHPVHKLFGLIMVVAAMVHIYLNFRVFVNYMKIKSVAVYGILLVTFLVFLYGVAINNKVPERLAHKMDSAAMEAESNRHK